MNLLFPASVLPGRNISFGYITLNGKSVLLQKRQPAAIQQAVDGGCNVRHLFQIKTFPHRNNYIHGR
jgi:hypothetical protein